MSISYPASANRSVGAGVATTVPVSQQSIAILAANANRAPGSFIVNNATTNLWLNFSNAVSVATPPNIMVPANGGSMDIPERYTGVVNGIWDGVPAGSCVTEEFSYL